MDVNEGLPVPSELQRGWHHGREQWVDSGVFATGVLAATLGRDDLEGVDVLDVGCGTKIVKTLLDQGWPIGRYVGVDVASEVIQWLDENVDDRRFEFVRFEARNDLYNPEGPPLADFERLPVDGEFDLICLFSVFTHLDPDDYVAMLRLCRRHIRPDGRLVFSVFIDDPAVESAMTNAIQAALTSDDPARRAAAEAGIAAGIERRALGYWDAQPDTPLMQARYTRERALGLIDGTGWKVESVAPPSEYMQTRVVCRPD